MCTHPAVNVLATIITNCPDDQAVIDALELLPELAFSNPKLFGPDDRALLNFAIEMRLRRCAKIETATMVGRDS